MPHSTHDSSATTSMSRPSSTSTNPFPKPAGTTLLVPETAADQVSPSRSTFSFESSPKSVQAISDRNVAFDDARHTRSASGVSDTKLPVVIGQRPQTARQRHQYFEDQFAYKDDATSSARDRVSKDAPIIADISTNVIIKDEYTLVNDLLHQLSLRYQRPESSIMISVKHSACLMMGGSFDPTYILTITALPVSVQPTLNKRNAALLQKFMTETIGVHADRGVVKFISIAEDNLAIGGNTLLGEIERLERQQLGDGTGLVRALTKSSRKSGVTKAKSSFSLSRNPSQAVGGRVTPPAPGPVDSGIAVNDKIKEEDADDFSRQTSMKHKKSKHLKDKSITKSSPFLNIPTPTILEDEPAPKIPKRKSFISIFSRR